MALNRSQKIKRLWRHVDMNRPTHSRAGDEVCSDIPQTVIHHFQVNGSGVQGYEPDRRQSSRPGNIFALMDGGERIMVNELPLGGGDSLIVLVQNWSREIGR